MSPAAIVMLLFAILLFGFSAGWLCGGMYEQAAQLKRELHELRGRRP